MSSSKVLQEFDDLFRESVGRMCVSDAPMGAFVSGGIDSSLIARYAVDQTEDIKLFTANVLGKHSEYKDALLLSKSLDKKLFDYKYEKEMALKNWASLTWHYESPIVVLFNAIPFSGVSKLAREHKVKAVLTGEGADELFLGYPKLLTKRYDSFIKLLFEILNKLYGFIPKLRSYVTNTGGSQDLVGLFHDASNNFSNELTFQEKAAVYDFVPKNKRDEHLLSSCMLQDDIVTLLWRNDRMGMIHSIESRFPFLDEDLIAFSMNLPSKYKIGRTWKFHNYKHPFLIDKYLVRKLAEDKLPKSLVEKRKNGFPLHGLRDIYVKPSFFENGTVSEILQLDRRKITYMCENKNNYLISLLASVEIWAKLFIEKKTIATVDQLILEHIRIE
ncbi:MAG: asparagine synthase [Flavobacteriales bacterium]|nr:asparagine synthase [Flavobacteriales bacterium]